MPAAQEFLETEPVRTDIDAFQGALVVEFGAPWCGHCQAAQPLVAAAFTAYPQVQHMKVEDGAGRPLGRSFRVKLWPTLVFMRDGTEVARLVRPQSSAAISEALAQVSAA